MTRRTDGCVSPLSGEPLFSVIVPTFDRSSFLRQAVASVLEQSVTSLECLVVDDGGHRLVDVPSDDRVSIVRRESNGGTAAARNAGLDAARGRYVTFLDDDDLFTQRRLSMSLEGLDRADISVCGVRFVDGTDRPGRRLEGYVGDDLLTHLVPNMGQMATARQAAPRFDERLRCCEDIEWWIRACQALRVATVPETGLLYRRHGGFRHLKSATERAEARTEILAWHGDFFDERPRSAAFQWKRIGMYFAAAGDARRARAAFKRSLRASFSIRTVRHFARTLVPAH